MSATSWAILYSSALNATVPQCLDTTLSVGTRIARIGDLMQPLDRCGSVDGDNSFHFYSLNTATSTITDRSCSDPTCTMCTTSSYTVDPSTSKCLGTHWTFPSPSSDYTSLSNFDSSFNATNFMYQPNFLDRFCGTVSSACRNPIYTTCTRLGQDFYGYSVYGTSGSIAYVQPYGCTDPQCNNCFIDPSVPPNFVAGSTNECFADTNTTSARKYTLVNNTAIPTAFPNGTVPVVDLNAHPDPFVPLSSPPSGPAAPGKTNLTVILSSVFGVLVLSGFIAGAILFYRYRQKKGLFEPKRTSEPSETLDNDLSKFGINLAPVSNAPPSVSISAAAHNNYHSNGTSSSSGVNPSYSAVNQELGAADSVQGAGTSYSSYAPPPTSYLPAPSSDPARSVSDGTSFELQSSLMPPAPGLPAISQTYTIPSSTAMMQFVAVEDHESPKGTQELPFYKNETINVFQVYPNGWAMAQNNNSLRFGYAPLNKIRALGPESVHDPSLPAYSESSH
ncbi:uncharacterized protein BJ171DRAFT_515965 [Polychytrium aggregatum]|uniref:uncharacterized protein n=1 Tax=Polychytrium aggregatum TaxID=110093 RepID=UPI0022FE8A88|nr:uncharacterized protein BJ171DRAFT_515965 [Polychytrium aggregatum]KAI9201930.1 hypothetical protein BJ171DRAFT_515965 [Polychytrium aggregatum]